jgi:hypothetical protein
MANTPTIMIIRHGEKPSAESNSSYTGINLTGVAMTTTADDLIPQGWMRCGALVRFFCPGSRPPVPGIATPTDLYAAASTESCARVFSADPKFPATFPQPPPIAPAANTKATHSLREQELLLGISALAQLPINDTYIVAGGVHDGEAALAAAVAQLPSERVALIAWEHKHIPLLARAVNAALHANISASSIPRSWNPWRFDLVWVFSFNNSSNAWTFTQVPQNLLPGDIDGPMGKTNLAPP